MKTILIPLATAALLALPACDNLSDTENDIIGGVAGATVGVLTARALNANTNWTILAALGGAVAGTLVARNRQTGECAYANGDGTYRAGPCR
ncbi:glycine zipper 2TM domain-containing protein [Litoreibacter ponti]|nr:glycine zipper 2TM domain-containing protein [Litoreibacter ponti]